MELRVRLTYSQFANIICDMIKGQDIVVLAVLMEDGFDRLAYAELGKAACLSASEAHAAVKRLQEAALVNGDRRPMKRNAMEFLVHGLRYAFPMRPTGRLVRGTPTAYAAPVASECFASTGLKPVWNGSSGDVYGQGCEPVYPTAPEAAKRSPGLYDRLAVIDMLRGGRIRERQFAERKLQEMMA